MRRPLPSMPTKIGKGEGQLDIIAWAGYAEDGSTDPAYDWVTDFEKDTGCQVNVKVGNTSDEMVALMKTGDYDGVSASGNASQRLIAAGDVAPVNTDLLDNYGDIAGFLKDQNYNSVGGQMYGVPHGWGANLLQYRTDVVTTKPDSWAAVYDKDSPYAGKITAYDDWTSIADAAVYLKTAKPELKIENPYALDQDQLKAAVDLLKTQRQSVGEYWSDYLKQIQAFTNGDSVIGTSWQVIVNLAQGEKVPVEAILPEEGATGWSDTWMIGSKTEHPNCAYAWMDHIISPEANDAVAEWFGEAPANAKACDVATEGFCDSYHAGDAAYADQIWYWTTPIEQCLDGRTDEKCTTYQDWTTAWTEIKG